MPTCAVAEFRFDTKVWSDVGKIEPTNVAVDRPKK
jgi:phosphohistidine phosphatase